MAVMGGRLDSIACGASGFLSEGQSASVMVAPARPLAISLRAKMPAGSHANCGCATLPWPAAAGTRVASMAGGAAAPAIAGAA